MLAIHEFSTEFVPIIGAEARIDIIDWHGKRAVCKARIPKTYRNEKLDHWLRTKRTREEAEILHRAKLLGVDCPALYFADPEKTELVMEYVQGVLLRDFKGVGAGAKKVNESSLSGLYFVLGKYAAKLHSGNLIHGDLTTKNVIITQDNRLVLIDFGLSFISERIEDRAEDLHLLKQALKSTMSPDQAKDIFDIVIQGYRSVSGRVAKQIFTQIQEIERRGRYARVD
ncbi:MAG: KEOPS complex kinase/ATPase Bud32 [archaeon]|nr:KEOPS complex kinase/ATPase Bud32 [archaeon]